MFCHNLRRLTMGGFTGAPPVWVGKDFGAKTFLHESNTIPGRANRLLARFVDEAFVGFSDAAARLRARQVTTTGTPVRAQFQPRDAAVCREIQSHFGGAKTDVIRNSECHPSAKRRTCCFSR